MTRTRAVLLVRAALLAVPAAGSAALAHLQADGCLDLAPLLLTVFLTWLTATAVLRSRPRVGALLGWVLGAQVAGHLLLSVECGSAPALPGTGMIAAHLAAALLVAPVLARRDAGLAAAERVSPPSGCRCGSARSALAVRPLLPWSPPTCCCPAAHRCTPSPGGVPRSVADPDPTCHHPHPPETSVPALTPALLIPALLTPALALLLLSGCGASDSPAVSSVAAPTRPARREPDPQRDP